MEQVAAPPYRPATAQASPPAPVRSGSSAGLHNPPKNSTEKQEVSAFLPEGGTKIAQDKSAAADAVLGKAKIKFAAP